MIACIQTIPERLWHAEEQVREIVFPARPHGLEPAIYIDKAKIGPFRAFIQTLREVPSGDHYRLHMQDDITYCDDFVDYLPEVERVMREDDIPLLSLFAPRRKHMVEQLAKGKRIGTFPNFLWMQCVVMSPWLVSKLLEHAEGYNDKHDDVYVSSILYYYYKTAKVHLPSLVQHDITIPSSMKHANNEKRTSPLFDKDFVTKWKAQKLNQPQ